MDTQKKSLAQELLATNFQKLIFSKPEKTNPIKKIQIRPIQLKSEQMWQLERFQGAQAFHENIRHDALLARIGTLLDGQFLQVDCFSQSKQVSILIDRRGNLKVIRKNIQNDFTLALGANSLLNPVNVAHNKKKNYILQEGEPIPFLVDLGVMNPNGMVVRSRYDKFKQINRFLEFIQDVVPELEVLCKKKGSARIVDFGCGKSYLTFAVYYYLHELKQLPVQILGLDLKETVISECSGLAKKYDYTDLSFAVGDIAQAQKLLGSSSLSAEPFRVDMVISLHACDTATDLALARAIAWRSKIIMCVPCCQHEINEQIKTQASAIGREVLAGAFKYGILRERIAALLTDAMRAELLEEAGYKVQILEFIDIAHTPKNLLLRAVFSGSENDSATLSPCEKSSSKPARLTEIFAVDQCLERELKK